MANVDVLLWWSIHVHNTPSSHYGDIEVGIGPIRIVPLTPPVSVLQKVTKGA